MVQRLEALIGENKQLGEKSNLETTKGPRCRLVLCHYGRGLDNGHATTLSTRADPSLCEYAQSQFLLPPLWNIADWNQLNACAGRSSLPACRNNYLFGILNLFILEPRFDRRVGNTSLLERLKPQGLCLVPIVVDGDPLMLLHQHLWLEKIS